MRRPFSIEDLKKSKVAGINQHLFEKAEEKKKRSKREDCEQVRWMWGQLSWWAITENILVAREHRFHPERKWRFDFALPDKLIACEYEGIHSEKSRHTTVTGYQGDIEKYNEATALGWRVLRFTAKTYKTVIKELHKLVNSEQ